MKDPAAKSEVEEIDVEKMESMNKIKQAEREDDLYRIYRRSYQKAYYREAPIPNRQGVIKSFHFNEIWDYIRKAKVNANTIEYLARCYGEEY